MNSSFLCNALHYAKDNIKETRKPNDYVTMFSSSMLKVNIEIKNECVNMYIFI